MMNAMRSHHEATSPKRNRSGKLPDVDAYSETLRTGTPDKYAYTMLLGYDRIDLSKLLRELERGLPYRAYERLSRNVGMSSDRLLRSVDIARRTLIRRRSEGRFAADESDRLLRVARVFGAALSLFEGDRDAALEWLEEPQLAFGGAIPLDVARTEVGAREVEDLAYRLEHGVFS